MNPKARIVILLAVVVALLLSASLVEASQGTVICHYPDSQAPFLMIIAADGLSGHQEHGDFVMAPWDRCTFSDQRPVPIFLPLLQR